MLLYLAVRACLRHAKGVRELAIHQPLHPSVDVDQDMPWQGERRVLCQGSQSVS